MYITSSRRTVQLGYTQEIPYTKVNQVYSSQTVQGRAAQSYSMWRAVEKHSNNQASILSMDNRVRMGGHWALWAVCCLLLFGISEMYYVRQCASLSASRNFAKNDAYAQREKEKQSE